MRWTGGGPRRTALRGTVLLAGYLAAVLLEVGLHTAGHGWRWFAEHQGPQIVLALVMMAVPSGFAGYLLARRRHAVLGLLATWLIPGVFVFWSDAGHALREPEQYKPALEAWPDLFVGPLVLLFFAGPLTVLLFVALPAAAGWFVRHKAEPMFGPWPPMDRGL